MSVLQAFLLGVMMSWTPSLIFLACVLWRAPFIEGRSENADCEPHQKGDPQGLKYHG
jgi:hypothetical protein